MRFVILLLFFANLFAQSFPVFKQHKFWGTSNDDHPTDLLIGPDNKLYASGYISEKAKNTGVLVKINPETLKAEWMKLFPVPENSAILDLAVSGKNSVLFSGYKTAQGNYDYFFGEIDTLGNVLWQKTYGGKSTDIATAVARTKFKGVFITGNSWSYDITGLLFSENLRQNNALCLLNNEQGKPIRKFLLGGNGNDWVSAIKETQDGGFILALASNSSDLINLGETKKKFYTDIYVLKLDFAGNVQWKRNISLPYEDLGLDVLETSGGSFVIVGYTYLPEKNKDFLFIKLNKLGKVIVIKNFGSKAVEQFNAITETQDGGFVAVGSAYARELLDKHFKGRTDVCVFRTTPLGAVTWRKHFGGPNDEKGVAVVRSSENEFIILAEKENHFNPEKKSYGKDFWFLKIEDKPCKELKPFFEIDARNNTEIVGTPVKFFNKSNFGDKFIWDFGDGTSSTEKSPVKTYKEAGVYLLRLTVHANEGCSRTYVYPKALVITEY